MAADHFAQAMNLPLSSRQRTAAGFFAVSHLTNLPFASWQRVVAAAVFIGAGVGAAIAAGATVALAAGAAMAAPAFIGAGFAATVAVAFVAGVAAAAVVPALAPKVVSIRAAARERTRRRFMVVSGKAPGWRQDKAILALH
jgi:hypothetical protein